MIYLAGPYTHHNPEIREQRFADLTCAAHRLMIEGHVVFSPVTHGHTIAERHDTPIDFEWWEDQSLGMLRHASKMIVVMLHGWQESRGVAAEIRTAEILGIPVEYIKL